MMNAEEERRRWAVERVLAHQPSLILVPARVVELAEPLVAYARGNDPEQTAPPNPGRPSE